MKIQSKKYYKVSINFHNQEVYFNDNGIAEIEDELGKEIIEGFSGSIWEEGKEPKKEEKVKEVSNEEVTFLKQENEKLKIIIKEKDKLIETTNQNEQVWRKAYSELETSIKKGEPVIPIISIEDDKKEEDFAIPEGYEDLYNEMKQKQVNALRKWIKESFNKTDEDLKDIKGKVDLIKFVFDNCIK